MPASSPNRSPLEFDRRLLLAFVTIALLFGGASRPDVLAPVIPRLSAVFVLSVLVVRRQLSLAAWHWTERAVWALLFAVPLIQLVPLPYALWSGLPLRDYPRQLFVLLDMRPAMPLSLTPERTVNALCALLPPFAAYCLGRRADDEAIRRGFLLILAIALGSALLGLMQMAAGPASSLRVYEITNDEDAVGIFSNANHFGSFLAASLPAIALFVRGRQRQNERLGGGTIFAAWAAGGLLLGAELLTHSRAGLGLFVFSAAVTGYLLRPSGSSLRKLAMPALAGVVALAGAAFLGRHLIFETAGAGQPEGRVQTLPAILRIIADSFPVGTGMGSFEAVYRGYERIERLSFGYLNNAHDDYLQLLVEAGLPAAVGLVLFAIFLGLAFPRLWSRRRALPGRGVLLATAAATAVVVFLVHSAVDYPLRGAGIATIFALSCGVIARYWGTLRSQTGGR